jgi:phenylpropionate dioxygenase-like ring-hydroxylating dioxygenase large terminal subunit
MTSLNGTAVSLPWPKEWSEVPKEVFHRPDVYRQELERIFHGPEWHPLAHVAEVPNSGGYKTAFVGESPVLIVRGDDGRVRVFSNSCPHRGTQLKVCHRGHSAEIECPYHRWLFNNQGDLLGAPGIRGFPATFRKEDHGLRPLRFEEFCGVIFVTLSDAAPSLPDYLGEVGDYIRAAIGSDDELELLGYQKVLFDTNWKEYGDQEGYHAPLLHKAFSLLKWQGGIGSRSMTRYGHMAVRADLKKAPPSNFLKDPSLVDVRDPGHAPQSVVVTMFPLNIIVRHLDVISMRFAFPHSPDEVEVHYAYFAQKSDSQELKRHRLRQASNLLGPSGLISLEDGAVFNRVHEGSASAGTVEFQKGVRGRMDPPAVIEQNDEAGNLIKWERYRSIMGFERGQI